MKDHIDSHISLNEYLPKFLGKYNAVSVSEIDCSKVDNDEFERLGDALMETNHPGEAHTMMDKMMGGEDSENLRQMHINMGRSYLNCLSDNRKRAAGTINMMDKNPGGWTGMPMMNDGFDYIWIINSLLVGVLLVVMIRFFWKKGGGK